MQKQNTNIQYAELSTLTPDLGVFLVTGTSQDVQEAARSFIKCQMVSQSTFARVVAGKRPRRLVPWL